MLTAALLRAGLLDVDPDTAPPDVDLADAGVVYAEALTSRSTPNPTALRWARYAHRASASTRGADNDQSVHAAAVLADVLAAYRLDTAAIGVRRRLVAVLTGRDGALAATTITACVRLAVTEHAAGYCQAGITRLTGAWQRWSARYGTADLHSVAMRLDLAAMLAACGRAKEAAHTSRQAFAAFAATGGSTGGGTPALSELPHPPVAGPPTGGNHATVCARRRRRPSRTDSLRRTRSAAWSFACPELLP
ncbi:hypothetical protein GCM10009827_101400 [Dactylosporangium maewongense]|uniref:Uncharacterized protein n=1 Tax=Dactylosporangium maewongense TaxID=634393 RepID=A0ABP4NMZ1_9ACTN